MNPAGVAHPLLAWLAPALTALMLYGLGQGLVKKWIGEVPPARFCLYYVFATAIVNLGYFTLSDHPPPFAPEGRTFLQFGVLSYLVDGLAWILYFQSIVAGPVAIVGTLSAAYPALTVLFARLFLHEELAAQQYVAVALVIGGCVGLSWAPADPKASFSSRRWIPLSLLALLCWGTSNTLIKYSYSLPQASDPNLALCSSMGGALSLGLYGLLRGRQGPHSARAWLHSLIPMSMMAGGSLGIIIAAKYGPISIVTPLIGAYPVVTVIFSATVLKEQVTRLQYACIATIIAGILLCPG